MTRPRIASERFVAQLPARIQSSVTVIYSPLLDIRPLSASIKTDSFRGLIFSSANGVNAAVSAGVPQHLPAYCIGETTTDTAGKAGWDARMAGATAEELIANLLKLRPDSPLLHLRGEHSRGNIAGRLTESGLTTGEQVIYRQLLRPLTAEAMTASAGKHPIIAPFFSPRTARQFADVWAGTAPLWAAAISEAAAEPLKTLENLHLRIAKEPTPKKMRKAVKKLVKHAMRVEGARTAD